MLNPVKIISVDSGRSNVKSFCEDKTSIFQSVAAPLDGKFNLTIDTLPTDLWVEYLEKNWLIGDLAVRQRGKNLIVDRNPDKCNPNNILLTLAACSQYANNKNVILLTNVPALDYSQQKADIEATMHGQYRLIHRAGDLAGKTVEFNIEECYAFPEGESAYFGACFDLKMNLINKDLWNYPTIVLDIGDETTNYISMNPGGDPVDTDSGTLKLGFHEVYVELHRWLLKQGVDINIPQLTRKIVQNEPIFSGAKEIYYGEYLDGLYSNFEYQVYSQLTTLISVRQYRNIVFVGGAINPLKQFLQKRYDTLQAVFATGGSQLLNCYGQYIIYRKLTE